MRLALAAFALAMAPPSLGQDAVPEDPASRPAVIAPLAVRSLMLDAAWAGPRVVAVGERGHILHSADAGRTWTQSPVPASANLTAVYFADAKHGWAVGHVETILRTQDGGDSWELVHFEPANPQPLLDVAFADATRGVAVGAYGVIYVTADGGKVWSQVPFEPAPLPGAEKVEESADEMEAGVDLGFEFHLNAITRGPTGRMYLGAEAGRLFRSDDDGASWRELPSPYDGSLACSRSMATSCWPSACAATCSGRRTAARTGPRSRPARRPCLPRARASTGTPSSSQARRA
jgi:photosystem II stability/assembly factor-like uncharacterized protein